MIMRLLEDFFKEFGVRVSGVIIGPVITVKTYLTLEVLNGLEKNACQV
jgi:hypothetical protein